MRTILFLIFTLTAFTVRAEDVVETLLYMKPDINAVVWDTDGDGKPDINGVVYDKSETYRPTKQQINAIDQDLVEEYSASKEQDNSKATVEQLEAGLARLQAQLESLKKD